MRPFVTQPLAALCLTLACCALACVQKAAPIEETCTGQTPLVPGVPGSPGHLLPSEIDSLRLPP